MLTDPSLHDLLPGQLRLERSDFGKTAKVARRLTELGAKESLEDIPTRVGSDGSATHADDVHVVVLDTLPGGKVVVYQTGADSRDFVRAYRSPNTAAADSHAAFDLSFRHGLCKRDHEVRIIVVGIETMGAEIDHFMPRRAKMRDQVFLQGKSTMIGGNSNTHLILLPGVPPPNRQRR
jgi:hypothetical protein